MRLLMIGNPCISKSFFFCFFPDQIWLADLAESKKAGIYYASEITYDLILIALYDPILKKNENITNLLVSLRQCGIHTPILVISPEQSVAYRVDILNAGADDFLVIPYDESELAARMNALTRRSHSLILHELTYHDLLLNLNNHGLYCGSTSITLILKEYEILQLLMKHSSQILSKNRLLEQVWGHDSNAEDNNVEVYVSRLRRKIAFLQSEVMIKNYQKVGYQLSYLRKKQE